MNQTVKEICFISPSEKLARKVQRIVKERNENIDIRVGLFDDAIKIAKDLYKSGTGGPYILETMAALYQQIIFNRR